MMSKSLTFLAIAAGASVGLSACQGMFGNCVEDKDCATGEACVSGSCQSSAFATCRTESDCPTGNFCPSGQCLPDCTKLGCGGGQTCNTGTHLCDFIVKTAPSNGGGTNGSSSGSIGNSSGNGGSSSSSSGTTVSTDYCASCTTGADCGGGNNFCLTDSAGNNYCGTDCSAGQSCPSSATCEQILDQANNPVGSNCIPSSGSCSASSSSSSGGTSTSSCTGFPCGGSSSSGSSSSSSSTQGGSSSSGSSSSTNSCTSETWANFAQAFFANNCDNCHHHGSEFSTYSAVVSDFSSIQSEISSGYMPENATLSSTEENDILTWINCGMPQ